LGGSTGAGGRREVGEVGEVGRNFEPVTASPKPGRAATGRGDFARGRQPMIGHISRSLAVHAGIRQGMGKKAGQVRVCVGVFVSVSVSASAEDKAQVQAQDR
jgi:hypothetical protein